MKFKGPTSPHSLERGSRGGLATLAEGCNDLQYGRGDMNLHFEQLAGSLGRSGSFGAVSGHSLKGVHSASDGSSPSAP